MSTEPTEPIDSEQLPSPTGPTGPTEPIESEQLPRPTGPTEPIESEQLPGPTGPTEPIESEQLPGPTGLTEPAPLVTTAPPLVIDIEELLNSREAVLAKEATDRATLLPLLNETREMLRPQMFAWAAAGFPPIYVVQQFTVSPPAICSDGVTRTVYDYTVHLLGQEMIPTIAAIQALCVGVQISYSFSGNTLRIHVSKT